MGQATTYRTCPRSGLQFEAQAEKLIMWNAVAGVLFLAFGGLLAIGGMFDVGSLGAYLLYVTQVCCI